MKRPSNLGTALGLVLCGLVLLLFPKFTELVGWPAWIFSGAGLLLVLIGFMGPVLKRGTDETLPPAQIFQSRGNC